MQLYWSNSFHLGVLNKLKAHWLAHGIIISGATHTRLRLWKLPRAEEAEDKAALLGMKYTRILHTYQTDFE